MMLRLQPLGELAPSCGRESRAPGAAAGTATCDAVAACHLFAETQEAAQPVPEFSERLEIGLRHRSVRPAYLSNRNVAMVTANKRAHRA